MSKQRKLTGKDAVASKKAPHGGRQCRWCKGEVFPPRQTYCSEQCVHEWRLRSDVAYLRSQLFLRDKGVCGSCALDTVKLRRELYELSIGEREARGAEYGIDAYHSNKLMLWEADHTVAVVNGGGLVGLDGFATLCVACHRKKTQRDLLQRP